MSMYTASTSAFPLRKSTLALLLACLSGAALAAGPQTPSYNIGDAMKDTGAPKPPTQQTTAPAAPVITQQDEKPLTLAEGETIQVRDFKLEGADFLDAKEISEALAAYRNRQLSMKEINEAANKITALCRNKGFMVARAYVPKQSMQDGILLIQVVVGKYGNFNLKNTTLVKDAYIRDVFEQAKAQDGAVTQAGLERALLLVGDMPGAKLPTVNIAPGSLPGTSDFLIQAEGGDRVNGYATLDNYGTRLTGKDRLSAGLYVNSPLGIADRLSLNGMTSDGAGLDNARVAYALPLAANGLRAEFSTARTTYQLGAEYKDLDASGTSYTNDVTLSYPLIRSREDTLTLSLNLADKRLRDTQAAADTTVGKRADVATLSLQRETYGQSFGVNTYMNLSGSVTAGKLRFEDEAQRQSNAAGANTAGNYSKLNLSYTGNFALNDKWSLLTGAQLQKSLGKNLDGSEQFSVSGANGIKSYADGVTSDNGYLVNVELKYAFAPLAGIDQAVGLFSNYGEVRTQNGSYTTINKIAVSDVGLAYYVSDKALFGRLQVAKTLGKQVETQAYNNDLRVLLQLGAHF